MAPSYGGCVTVFVIEDADGAKLWWVCVWMHKDSVVQ
jgi:hypothetical protein